MDGSAKILTNVQTLQDGALHQENVCYTEISRLVDTPKSLLKKIRLRLS